MRTAHLHLQNQPLRRPQLTSTPSQPRNGLGFVEEGMEELQAQAETELQEKYKDLLAMLEAIAADEVIYTFSAVGHLSEADFEDLALLVALLPRVDMDTFLYHLNDLTTLQKT